MTTFFKKTGALLAGIVLVAGIGLSIGTPKTETEVDAATSESSACPTGTIVSGVTMTFSTTPSSYFTIVHSKNGCTNYGSYAPWRVYGPTSSPATPANLVEFSVTSGISGISISSIVITTSSSTYATAATSGTVKTGTSSADAVELIATYKAAATTSPYTGTWTTSHLTNVTYVSYLPIAQTRWTSLVINYTGTPVASVTSITASNFKSQFYPGNAFSIGNLIVKDNLNNILTTEQYSVDSSAFVSGTPGTYPIVVTYTATPSITTTYYVTVNTPATSGSLSYDFSVGDQGWSKGATAVEMYNTVWAGFKAQNESMIFQDIGGLVAMDNSSSVTKIEVTVNSAAYTGGALNKYEFFALDDTGSTIDYVIVNPKVITGSTGSTFITEANAASRVFTMVSLTKIVGLKVVCASYVTSGAITRIGVAASLVSTADANDIIAAKTNVNYLDGLTCSSLGTAKATMEANYAALTPAQKAIFDAMLTEDNATTYSTRYSYLLARANAAIGVAEAPTINDGNDSMMLITIISVIGLTSIVAYFMLKGRKEEQA